MIQFQDSPSIFVTATGVSIALLLTCIVAFTRHYKEMKAKNNGESLSSNQRKVLVIPTVAFILVTIVYVIILL